MGARLAELRMLDQLKGWLADSIQGPYLRLREALRMRTIQAILNEKVPKSPAEPDS